MYGLMLKFGPQMLFEEYAQQYIIENGKAKFEKVASIVKSSDRIKQYVDYLVNNSSIPDANSLQHLMNSHSYFMWSKEETICLGALGVILIWSGTTYNGFSQEKDELESEVIAKLIDHCSRLKYNQFNSFFQRYYRRLSLIMSNSSSN